MPNNGTAKLFMHGRSQAVRLPKEFRLPGKEVRVRRIGHGVLLEPIDLPFDVKAWFDRIDAHLDEPFMADGRQQPAMPSRRNIFDE
jgi:antitoxin VapB